MHVSGPLGQVAVRRTDSPARNEAYVLAVLASRFMERCLRCPDAPRHIGLLPASSLLRHRPVHKDVMRRLRMAQFISILIFAPKRGTMMSQ